MFDSQADLVIAMALVATTVALGISLRHRLDVRAARAFLGDPAFVAAAGTGAVLGLMAAGLGVVYVLWFTAVVAPDTLLHVSPLLFATWLVLLCACTREALRAVLLLTGCAPTGAAAP